MVTSSPTFRINFKTKHIVLPRELSESSARHAEHHYEEALSEFLNPHCLKEPPGSPFSRAGLRSYSCEKVNALNGKQKFVTNLALLKPTSPNLSLTAASTYTANGPTKPVKSCRLFRKTYSALERSTASSDLNFSHANSDGSAVMAEPIPWAAERILPREELSPQLEGSNRDFVVGQSNESSSLDMLLARVEGSNSTERIALGKKAGFIAELVRNVPSSEIIAKSIVLRILNQLAFSCEDNGVQIVMSEGFLPAVQVLLEQPNDSLKIEALTLLTNITACSAEASHLMIRKSNLIEMLKLVCLSTNPSVTLRALGTLNCLSRYGQLVFILNDAQFLRDVIPNIPIERGQTEDERSLMILLRECIRGNLLDSIQRRKLRTARMAVITMMRMLKSCLEGKPFVGISCKLNTVLRSVEILSASIHNKLEFMTAGVVELLTKILVEWKEDPSQILNEQLEVAETVLSTMLLYVQVPLGKKALQSYEVGQSLNNLIEANPSQKILSLAKQLLEDLQLDEFQVRSGFSVENASPDSRMRQGILHSRADIQIPFLRTPSPKSRLVRTLSPKAHMGHFLLNEELLTSDPRLTSQGTPWMQINQIGTEKVKMFVITSQPEQFNLQTCVESQPDKDDWNQAASKLLTRPSSASSTLSMASKRRLVLERPLSPLLILPIGGDASAENRIRLPKPSKN